MSFRMPALILMVMISTCLSEFAFADEKPAHPRILFNSDGGSASLYAYEPPITHDQLCRVMNELQGTQVDVFIQCVSFGFCVTYDTQVGERYGVGRTEFEDPNFRRWAQNVNGLVEKGEDPLEIWTTRAHELGFQFWPALRMNDIHHDWVENWPSLRAQWIQDRPQLIIGDAVSDFYRRRWSRTGKESDGFSWALDFAHQEVRDVKFAMIEEMCANYDVDGFEMDYLSHPMLFKKGQVEQGMPLLTESVRRVRARMDQIAQERGRELTLCARVPASVAQCEEIGIDITTWVQEGLVDVVAPTTRGYLDMTSKVREMVALAAGTDCRVAGALSDIKVRHYAPKGNASPSMMRAAAAGYWQEGASSIHLFNFDCHVASHGRAGVPLFNDGEREILSQLGDPTAIARGDKHYYITRDIEGDRPDQRGEMQLPLLVDKVGKAHRLVMSVGDDVAAARGDGALESERLIVSLSGYQSGADRLSFQLNGRPLSAPSGNAKLVFAGPNFQQGLNELVVKLDGREAGRTGPIVIEGVELTIDYR